jgi:hypothetical protein
MGFVWNRRIDKQLDLIERADIVAWRSEYLIKIKKWAEDEKENFYLEESWVDTSFTYQKCWQLRDNVKGIITGSSFKKRVSECILVHKMLFLQQTLLRTKTAIELVTAVGK